MLGIKANSKPYDNGFSDVISIQKIKSFGNKTILESELTTILNENACFVHTESNPEIYEEAETITLIIKSDKRVNSII